MLRRLCQICESEGGLFTCAKCGRIAGKKCWKEFVCKDCSRGVAMGKRQTKP